MVSSCSFSSFSPAPREGSAEMETERRADLLSPRPNRHWPIGLLYDYHTSHSSPSPSSNTLPTSLASVFAPSRSPSPSPSTSDQRTLRSSTSPYSARASGGPPLPWKITLHLQAPPSEVLLMGSSVEGCRSAFMNMVKVGPLSALFLSIPSPAALGMES